MRQERFMTATDTSNITQPTDHTEPTQASDVAVALLTVAVLVAAWVTAVIIWGLPGLFIPAVAMVPVMFALLVRIAWG